MPQITNLNRSPYFDDFDPVKNFYRVLFRPGYSIQARELTTLQSILQNQIENLSRSNFKQGSVVVPGQLIVDEKYNYVKISSFTNNLQITDFIGKKVTGFISGVTATIVNATPATITDSSTIFVKYENSGTSTTQPTFLQGETLTADSPGNPTLIVGIDGSVNPTDSPAIGYGCAATVEAGIYFINGCLVRNETETIILDKYKNTPSVKIGFDITESLVTPEEDPSLLDNSQGFSNFTAPGAHRLKISVSLAKREIDSPNTNDFVELLLVEGGSIKRTVEVPQNTLFEEVLARRTFDESGDYVVKDFTLNLRESLNDGSNNGVYTTEQGGDESKFIAALGAGKAYVKGFEIETISTKYVDVDKARDSVVKEENSITVQEGSNFTVNNLYGFPDISNLSGPTGSSIVSTNSYQEINLFNSYTDLNVGDSEVNVDNLPPTNDNYYSVVIRGLNSSQQVSPNTPYSVVVGQNQATGLVKRYQLTTSGNAASIILTKTGNLNLQSGQTIVITGGITATIYSVEYISTPKIGISKTKYIKYLNGTTNQDGTYDRLSTTYKMGVFGTEYFTKILCKNSLNFNPGRFVTGQSSNAVGIVEEVIAESKEVILSNVRGTFLPGETIVSELESSTNTTPSNIIEEENTIKYLRAVNYGSNFTSASGVSMYVNGTLVPNLLTTDLTVTSNQLRNVNITQAVRDTVGALNSSPVITFTGGDGAEYEAILNQNVVFTFDSSNARSFFSNNPGNNSSGDIYSQQAPYEIAAGATFSATEGSYYITADNINTRPELELNNGDVIQVIDNSGILRKYIVSYVSPVGSSKAARIYIRGIILSEFSRKTVSRVRSKLNGIAGDSLLLPLPNKNVKTTVLNPSNTNINYVTQREFIDVLGGSGSINLTVGTNEQFLGFSSDNFILTRVSDGKFIDISGANVVTFSNSNQTCTINLGASFANTEFKFIAPVAKFDTTPKTKTLIQSEEYVVNTGFSDPVIPLSYADGYRLRGVYLSSNGNTPTISDVDITDRFIFDGGQRDNYYDLARIVRKPGALVPTDKILVVYDYFKHVGTGDYFSVNSYTNIDYKDIPSFNSRVYGNISLRDCIDFRPRVSNFSSNNGADGLSLLPGYSNAITSNSIKFAGTGSSYSYVPLYSTAFQTGFEYYLNRIDALYLTKNGQFKISRGTPSLNPQPPAELSDSMLLYYFNIPAYTYNTSDIKVRSIDNRRYTMRDIGNLQTRIEKLEYYTVLSLIEQDTFNSQVRDEFGNERFKNGILVDNFEGHNVGEVTSTDYTCSIDVQSGILRPSYAISQVGLVESNIVDSQRTSSGYKKTGDLVSLPFTESPIVTNSDSTRFISVNPSRVARFTGSMSLSPNVDEWRDVTTTPELIINENSVFDTISANSNNAWGSFWNEWQISWTGTPVYNLSNSTSSKSANQFSEPISNVLAATNRTRTRNGTQNRLTPYGTSTVSVGSRTTGYSYNSYIRSKLVKFVAKGLQPNTRLYAFFDGIDVNAWVNPDNVTSISTPFTGIAGYAQKGFGTPIVTDSNGNISGIFLIPNGYSPIAGKTISTLESVDLSSFYDYGSTQRKFVAGTKTFRLTSSSSNSSDTIEVTTFAETEYTVSGLLETNSGSIQSTRPSFITRRTSSNFDSIQYIDNARNNINQGTSFVDPLAQTFFIEGYPEGVFVTSVDLYFQNKSETRPITAYLVETSGNIPSRKALPFSQVTLNTDSIIRIKSSNNTSVTFNSGDRVVGQTSGAVGVVKTSQTVNNSSLRYNIILNNYNGISFIPGEEIKISRTPEVTGVTFNVDQDSGIVEKIIVTNFGSAYVSNNTSITISGDNGGNTPAAAVAKIYDGRIYEIDLLNQGRGYYSAPTVNIIGGDSQARAKAVFRVTDPAVKMGVATSQDATVKTTFNFESPVYLQNNTAYALVLVTESSDYTVYTSRIGDAILNSLSVATSRPFVGSLFKSQNSSAWVEDTVEDLKFSVKRAVFSTSTTATLTLVNRETGYVNLPENPIEVSSTTGTSSLFGANPQIIRIKHPNHGMKPGDTVILSNVSGSGSPENIYGIPVSIINGLHFINNVGLDEYTIFIPSSQFGNSVVTGTGSGGGKFARATTNKLFQVIQPQIGLLEFPSTNTVHSVRTATGKAVDITSATLDYSLQPVESIIPGDNYYFNTTRVIASKTNEVYRSSSNELNGKSSLEYTISFSTERDNVSPIIDLERTNLITICNRVDNPTGTEGRFGSLSQVLTVVGGTNYNPSATQIIGSTVIRYTSSTGGTFTTSTGAQNTRLTQAGGASGQIVSVDTNNKIIKLIDVSGQFNTIDPIVQASTSASATGLSVSTKSGIVVGWDGVNKLRVKLTSQLPFENTDLINDFTGSTPQTFRALSSVSTSKGFLYVDETEPSGNSVASQYLTKEVNLETPATALDVRISANLFNNSDIKVLYKIKPEGSTQEFNRISWEYFNGTGLSDNTSSATPSTVEILSPSVEDLNSYIDYKYTVNNLPEFKSFAIKIIFIGNNPALVGRLEDLRVVAHS